MPEPDPVPSPQIVNPTPEVQTGPTIHIGEEFGTAKRTLPPAKVLLFALLGVLIVAAVISFTQRAKPQAGGTIVNVRAVQIPNQGAVLVAITFSLRSAAEKALWIKSIAGKVVASEGTQTSDALSSMDFGRYFQAFPELAQNAQPPLAPEDKIQPSDNVTRTVICSFPLSIDSFNHRQSLKLEINAYDQQLPIVLTE